MEAIRQIHAVAPVQIGDVLLRDAAGTGADIVATQKVLPVSPPVSGRTDPKCLQINLKKPRMHSGIKAVPAGYGRHESIMKIQFLKERWIFFPRLKKMEDAIFSSPTIPPNP